jgi:hypothetical protein
MEKLEELVYIGFKETDRRIHESSQETDRKMRESSQETDRKMRESSQETDRKMRETDRRIRETFEKTDLELQKLKEDIDRVGKNIDEVGKHIDKVGKNVKDITDSLGRFAENMVSPAVVKLFNARGIPITEYYQRAKSERLGIEYDIVAVNNDYVVVVSVKMTLRVEDVRTFLEKRLPIFKEVFPMYKDKKVLGAVAGASIVQESDIYAMKRGLFVLAQAGENIIVLNDDSFEPTVF